MITTAPIVCAECDAAVRCWHHGIYAAACPGCELRAVAQAPAWAVRAWLARISDAGARQRARAAVLAERARIAALRAASGARS